MREEPAGQEVGADRVDRRHAVLREEGARQIGVRFRVQTVDRIGVAAQAGAKTVLAADPVTKILVPFAAERETAGLRADLAHDVEQIGIELPSSAPAVGFTLPEAIGHRQDDRLRCIAEARRQRLKHIGVDVGAGARLEPFEIAAGNHRIE